MDILKPELMWIENRCYRKIPLRSSEKSKYKEEYCPVKAADMSQIYEDEDEYSDLLIKHEGSRFWISISVPGPLIGLVLGQQGKRRKLLEEQSGAKIIVPRKKEHGEDIVITGENKRDVGRAYRSIEAIASSGRLRHDSTHFISFPINSKEIQDSFLRFKEDVLANCKVRGVEASIFQKPEKLHITITPLILLDAKDIEEAASILQKCQSNVLKILNGKELIVRLKGIEYMNDDPAEVDVLFGKVQEIDDDTCLQIIADKLYQEFIEAGFSKKEYDNVKLHVTLMNTLFSSGKESDEGEKIRNKFDAKRILKKYGEFEFGEITLSEIHISIRYTEGKDGYYMHSSVMKLT